MADERKLPQLVMKRPDLDGLEGVTLPEGYAVRSFRDGDEAAWETIIAASFGREANPDLFDLRMRHDPAFRPERVWFITCHDEPVATAGAWSMPSFGENTGYIHMVGTLPGHRSQRLGYWVSMAALHQFVHEGRSNAMLQTDDERLAAVKTYFHLGFEPYLVDENQRDRWSTVCSALNDAKNWNDIFSERIEGPIHSIGKTETARKP